MKRGQGPYSRGHRGAAAQPWGTMGLFWGQGASLAENSAKVEGKKPAIEVVRQAVNNKIGKFTKRDIMELAPSLSSTSVERSLQELCNVGKIKKMGSGRATYYIISE